MQKLINKNMNTIEQIISTRVNYYLRDRNKPPPLEEQSRTPYQQPIVKRSISLIPKQDIIPDYFAQSPKRKVRKSSDDSDVVILRTIDDVIVMDQDLVVVLESINWQELLNQSGFQMDDEKLINLRMNIMTERLPFPVRRLLWMEYYAKNKRTMSHVDFHKLVKTDSKYDKQIRLDVDRTNILGGYFEKDYQNKNSLYQILIAYSNFDSEVGYTQGMNFIVGNLLSCYDIAPNEDTDGFQVVDIDKDEFVFFILLEIMINKGYNQYFMDGFPGMFRQREILSIYIERNCPDLLNHIHCLDQSVPLLFQSMYLSLLMNGSPQHFNSIITDLLIFDEEVILTRILLAMILHFKPRMLKMDFGQLQRFATSEMTTSFYDILKNEQNQIRWLWSLGLRRTGPINPDAVQVQNKLSVKQRLLNKFGL